ncbi:phosphotyrosine-specific ptp2-like protein, partial [Dimargaris xerosporica]
MPTSTPSLNFPVPDDGDPNTPDSVGFNHLGPETPYFTPMDQLLPAPTAGDQSGYFHEMRDTATAPHRPLTPVPTGPCAPRTGPLLAAFAAHHANGSPSSHNNYRPTVPSLLRRSPGTSATVVTRPPPSHNASSSGVAFPTLTPSNLAHLITVNRSDLSCSTLRRSSISSTHGLPTNVLLIDTRPHSQFRQSHIRGAVNICIPSTLLKRATFGVDKVVASLSSSPESQQLVREWDSFTHIVIMDQRSSTMQEQSGVFCLCQKFTQTTSTVHIGWLLGGFDAFARRFPHLCTEPLPKDAKGPLGDSPFHNRRLSAGVRYSEPKTCPIPSVVGSRAVDNPFFLSFRHNNEPTVGPETDAIVRPGPRFLQTPCPLPEFLARAIEKQSGPDYLSRAFEALQNAENERLAQMLQNQGGQAFDFKHSIERHDKNRYYNIIPYDDARVVLQSPSARDDYINASWLSSTLSNRRYISTQGPIPGTVDDFWAMVWEQRSRVVVMLTREWERSRVTCHRYWPSELDIPMAVGARMVVTLVAQDPLPNDPSITVRVMRLQHFASDARASACHVHYVAQLQYLGWPDFGIPADPQSVLRLRQL